MLKYIRTFWCKNDGAVTVDSTVVMAGVVGLGLASAGALSSGQNGLASSIQSALNGALVSGSTILQADFNEIDGLIRTGWGWLARGEYGGWTAQTGDDSYEIIRNGYGGVTTDDGGNMLDMGGSPGNLEIGRTIEGLIPGNTHTITLNAADIVGNNKVEVYFGGQLIGVIEAGRSMSEYAFEFIAGSGDGTDMLVLAEAGRRDNTGTYIHNVRIR